MSIQDLLTTSQAAAALRCSVWKVHRLVNSGQLTPRVKLPGRTGAYLFDPGDIKALHAQAVEEVDRLRELLAQSA